MTIKHWPEAWKAYLLLLPTVAIVGGLFGGGIILALLQSLGLFTLVGSPALSFDAYRNIFSDRTFYTSLGLSLYIALTATTIATICSIGLALLLRSAGRWLSFAFQITLPIPHLVGVAGILLLLSPSGFLSRVLFAIGLIHSDQDFPLLVNDSAQIGVILHFLWKEIPFITLILLAVLRGIGTDYDVQARVLGANRWQAFWQVTLPLMKPGIVSASLIVFGFIFGSFEVPFLLGSPNPRSLPILVYRAFTDIDLNQRTEAIALGLVLSLLSMAIAAAYLWFNRQPATP